MLLLGDASLLNIKSLVVLVVVAAVVVVVLPEGDE